MKKFKSIDLLCNVSEKVFLDRLRVALILLVVIGHATRMFSPMGVYSGRIAIDPIHELITTVIYSFHMPFFVMISGYVYGICVMKSKDYVFFWPVIRKKILRLMVPYCVWGVALVAPVLIALSVTPLTYWGYLKSGILLSLDCKHLWFLGALFLTFLLVHGGKCALCRLKVYNEIPLSIKCFVFILMAFVLRYISFPIYFQIWNAIYYLPFFLFGYFIKRSLLNKPLDRILLIICAFFILWSLGVIGAVSAVVFCFLMGVLRIEDTPPFSVVKAYGMGIYILHPMMLYVIYYYYPSSMNPYLYTIFSILMVMFVSILLCKLIKRINLSFLLGE